MGTLISLEEAVDIRRQAKRAGRQVVFTNGCFDLLHRGHVEYLGQAKAYGQLLMVGLNSDRSVRALKGPGRPVSNEHDRAAVLSALACVDHVLIFDEPTPVRLIERLVPDVLAKGGDWPVEQIVGREVVEADGGRVVSINSSVPEYSSTRLMEHMRIIPTATPGRGDDPHSPTAEQWGPAEQSAELKLVVQRLRESALTKHALAQDLAADIVAAAQTVVRALRRGNKILLCGNGGSAADAQHIAAELVGRFEVEREGLPAIALTTDSSALTSIANDCGFSMLFARQVAALATAGDVLLAISTSGNSANIVRAVEAAKHRGLTTIGLLGKGGGRLAELVDQALIVPASNTARIQEAHITIGHIVCEWVDRAYGVQSER